MSHAGCFLVARPVLRDQHFVQTVVLLLAHNDDGAFGLVVNRPHHINGLEFPVFQGGPCPAPGLFLLHGHEEWLPDTTGGPDGGLGPRVAAGIYLGDASSLDRVRQPEEGELLRFRVFKGYAGWGGGQLENELLAGAWAVVPATSSLLFDTDADELWDRLRPPTIAEPSVN
jgi:putative transcriptional regulator